jgi:hypothetical protein
MDGRLCAKRYVTGAGVYVTSCEQRVPSDGTKCGPKALRRAADRLVGAGLAFDWTRPNVHNSLVPSRRTAIVTTLALLIGFIPTFATVCVGWEASAQTRLACCAKSDAAGSSAKADDCCKDGEGRTNALTQSGLVAGLIPAPMQSLAAITLPSVTTFGRPSDSHVRPSPAPLYLLDSVFRL